MTDTLRIHVHESQAEAVLAVVAALPVPVAVERVRQERLDLRELTCLFARIAGTSSFTRMPFLYPLMAKQHITAYRAAGGQALEEVGSVDWVVLGVQASNLANTVRRHIAVNAIRTVEVHAFQGVTEHGLPQEPRPDDRPVAFEKKWLFTNAVSINRIQDELLRLPECDWPSTGYQSVTDHAPVMLPILKGCAPKRPRRIVELGCGLGQTTRSIALAFPDSEVVGLDVHPESIAIASAKFSLHNLRYAVADFAREIPFEARSQDVALSVGALNISKSQRHTAGEVYRILSPDGLLVNACITTAFKMFWDFPLSLFLPTSSDLFLADWVQAAAANGHCLTAHPWPQQQSLHHYRASKLDAFRKRFVGHLKRECGRPVQAYAPHQCSGIFISSKTPAGGQRLRPEDFSGGHLEMLSMALGALEGASGELLEAASCSACFNLAASGCSPESAAFLAACLPQRTAVLDRLFTPGMLAEVYRACAS